MFSKKIKIQFIAQNQDQLDFLQKPHPAKQFLPEWFQKTPRYIDGIQSVDTYGDPNSTIKKCMPLVDILTSGYHIPLTSDIWLENNGESDLSFRWAADDLEVVNFQKPEQHSLYPAPVGYYNSVFKWINHWIVKTPPGWSCLFLHPQHHNDLPFLSLSAIVDTDKHPAPVNFPFFVKKGFQGHIPQGTPLIQIIPFKRESFVSEFSYDKNNFLKQLWKKAHSTFFERYQKNFWTAKKFDTEKKCPFKF